MKKLIVILLIALRGTITYSQNLVPNPSFEDTLGCPFNEDISQSLGWSSYGTSPELYHTCAQNIWNVPNSYLGYQNAATGNAFAGIVVYQKSGAVESREFLGRKLSQNLTIGQKYYTSFKVNLPKKDTSIQNTNDGLVFACNKLGVLFSTVSYSEFNLPPINNFSHTYTDSIITDTANWVLVTGSFIADSNYSDIIVGVFFDTNNIDTIRLFKPLFDVFAYYFIDDICVSSDSLTCSQTVSVNEMKIDLSPFNIKPNPVTNYFILNNNTLNNPYDISVYNTLGQKLLEENNITDNTKTFYLNQFNNGLLLINLKTKNQNFYYKLLKN